MIGIEVMGRESMELGDHPHLFNKIFIICEFFVIHPDTHCNARVEHGEHRRDSVSNPQIAAGMSIAEAEKQLIHKTLAFTNGNREQAAKILGIGARTLYRKLKEYDLS